MLYSPTEHVEDLEEIWMKLCGKLARYRMKGAAEPSLWVRVGRSNALERPDIV